MTEFKLRRSKLLLATIKVSLQLALVVLAADAKPSKNSGSCDGFVRVDGVWTVTDDMLKEHDLQDVIDCAKDGNTISLETSKIIRPRDRIEIKKNLTIRGSVQGEENATLTCPGNKSLFLFEAVDVTIEHLLIRDCDFSYDHDIPSIIVVHNCRGDSQNLITLRMRDISFIRNMNRVGSVGFYLSHPQCYKLVLENVLFLENFYAGTIQLGGINNIKHLQLIRNENRYRFGFASSFFSGKSSTTTVAQLRAIGNNGYTFLHFEKAQVSIADSFIAENLFLHNFVATESTVSITNTKFLSNYISRNGIVDVKDSDLSVFNSSFVKNTGHPHCNYALNSDLTVNEVTFDENRSELGGGFRVATNKVNNELFPVRFIRFTIRFTNTSFTSNVGQYGGALYLNIRQLNRVVIIKNSLFFNNTSAYGGGLFFVTSDDSHFFPVEIKRTFFQENHATIGGGGIYSKAREAVPHINCDLKQRKLVDSKEINFTDNLKRCDYFRNNSVGSKGYGIQIAFEASGLVLAILENNGSLQWYKSGSIVEFDNWKSGDEIPVKKVMLVDKIGQGPARLLQTTGTFKLMQELSSILVNIDVEAQNGFLNDSFTLQVQNKKTAIFIGSPYRKPGKYSLRVWMDGVEESTVTIDMKFRKCIINEEETLNGTFCQICDSNQYNFSPSKTSCHLCPESANCSSLFAMPLAGYWNAFPCSIHVQKCLRVGACKGIDEEEFLSFLGKEPIDCNFNTSTIEWYSQNLCKDGYSGPLCGSCTNTTGKSSNECRQCLSNSICGLMIVVSIFVLATLVIFQIKGNLDPISLVSERETKRPSLLVVATSRRILRNPVEKFAAIDLQSRSNTRREIEDYKDQQEKRKRELVELTKITINYLQVLGVGLSMDVSWNKPIVRLLRIWDWFGGGAIEVSTAAVDCSIPTALEVPRSIVRQILSACLPIFVFLGGCIYWTFAAWKRKPSAVFLFKRVTLTFLVVSYISYISLTKAAVQIFHCVDVFDGQSINDDTVHKYWESDTIVRCFVDSHLILSLTLGIPLVLFSFLYPFCLTVFLIVARNNDHLESVAIQETIGLFYKGYEKEFAFWDSMILLRKAVLAAVVVFADSLGSNLQAILALTVLLLSLFLQTKFDPFKRDLGRLNELECASLFVGSFTFLSGIILNDPYMTSIVVEILTTIIVFGANVGLFFVLLMSLFRTFVGKLKLSLLAEGLTVSESTNLFSVVKIYLAFQAQKTLECVANGNQSKSDVGPSANNQEKTAVVSNAAGSDV